MAIRKVQLAACVLAFIVGAAFAVGAFAAASAPKAGARPRAEAQPVQAGSPQKLDLNTASVQSLETLPGVSQEMANQIVARRPYGSIEQFRTKSGLSASQIDKLAPLVSAQPLGPVRRPQLPPGAVAISPEEFSKGFTPPPSPSPGGRGVVPGGGGTPIPVPPGTVRQIPVPKGTVTENIPVPGATSPARPVRDLRAAVIYGAAAVTVALAAALWWRRTSPTRKAPRGR